MQYTETYRLQSILKQLGFDPGPVDGVYGRRTQAAVRAFQKSRGIEVDGVVGPVTLERLGAAGKVFVAPYKKLGDPLTPWLEEAYRHLDMREVVGPGSNPSILEMAKRLGAKILGIEYTDDDIAWCGMFAAYCLAVTLPNEPMPAVAVRALSFATWGQRLSAPSLGCICVYRRPGGHHVNFYEGEGSTSGRIRGVGGNQSNRVNSIWMPKESIIAFRWPSTVPLPVSGRVLLNADAQPIGNSLS